MGDTLIGTGRGGRRALESESSRDRADAVCDTTCEGRADGGPVPRVRDQSKNWVQVLGAVPARGARLEDQSRARSGSATRRRRPSSSSWSRPGKLTTAGAAGSSRTSWKARTRVTLPSAGTIAAVLRRHGLVQARKLRRRPSRYTGKLTTAEAPNEVWAADYKGQFRLGNREYCYPLTATDLHSRFILAIDALDSTDEEQARVAFEDAFAKYGLPLVIRTDNGTPFASAHGLAGLTRLSAFWLRLGIKHERTEPAHPEQNGQHERMHRTLKAEKTPASPEQLDAAARTLRRIPAGIQRTETPRGARHEATRRRVRSSNRQLPKPLPELNYPLHDDVVTVGRGGHIRLPRGRQAFLSGALVHQTVGLREEIHGRWLVTFASVDLGTYDPRTGSFDPVSPPPPAANP